MPHSVALRTEVRLVDIADADDERNKLGHVDAVLGELATLFGIVGEKSNCGQAEVAKDCRGDAVIACIGGKP